MIERIFRNWKTTAFGLVLIMFGGVLVWFEKATLSEFSAFLMGGFALMMARDGEGATSQEKGKTKTRKTHQNPEQRGDE
jgi:hypothetical protein